VRRPPVGPWGFNIKLPSSVRRFVWQQYSCQLRIARRTIVAVKYDLWKAPNEQLTGDSRLSVSLAPKGMEVAGYVCRISVGTWIIEGDKSARTYPTAEEAADAIIADLKL